MLSCQQLTELVTEYLEGEMSLGGRLRFQVHLGMCSHCRRYLAQMRATVNTLGQVPDEPIPDQVRDELMERFRDWKQGE